MSTESAASQEGLVVAAETETPPKAHPGDSTVQRTAEAALLAACGQQLGVALAPQRLHLPDGAYVDVDGVCEEPPVLVEAWAHQGPPKGAQTKKVLVDALKLSHIARGLPNRPWRLILLFSDEAAAKPFRGASWYAGALRDLGIELHVVDIPVGLREEILAAQLLQYR